MNADYQACLDHIEQYWDRITFSVPHDQDIHIGLPHPFIAPNEGFFRNDLFYWDSYFTILGLLESGRMELARGMIENFVFLLEKYGIIPARNRLYNLGISQPPFLTSMALAVFERTNDEPWLRKIASVAEHELESYWMSEKEPTHLVYRGLSRFSDHNITHVTAEHESGLDMTSRFHTRILDYLPVDLNVLLHTYERDLGDIARRFGNSADADRWYARAAERRATMNELMWSDTEGFFFDYDYVNRRPHIFYSPAGFYPLWGNIATPEQAAAMRENLVRLEFDGGLAATQVLDLDVTDDFKQWDYPNGWPNHQWIVIKGLLNYGFEEDARRIANKWLEMNKDIFKRTGTFWEKYDVVHHDVGKSGRYPTQSGFGWTNAVFLKLAKRFL